mgnify:CR=1 FL=1|jgi:hypothetical protein
MDPGIFKELGGKPTNAVCELTSELTVVTEMAYWEAWHANGTLWKKQEINMTKIRHPKLHYTDGMKS